MASRTSIEDIESGAEFERIKQNFRSSAVAPEVPANLTEAHDAFQELQIELQEFLSQHVSRIMSLQTLLSDSARGGRGPNSTIHDDSTLPRSRRVTGTSVHLHPPDTEAPNPTLDVLSNEAGSNLHSRHSSMKVAPGPVPVDVHVNALQTFLEGHLENIRTLQSSILSNSLDSHRPAPVSPIKDKLHARDNDRQLESYAQQLNLVVLISAVMAVFVVAFLILVKALVGSNHETPFNVGLFFGLFALAFHLINIGVAGRSTRTIRQHAILSEKDRPELDPLYFKFYLVICEQLLFVASLCFLISIMVMIFLIFSSLAFPLLLLLLTGIGGLVVFSSAYCKVAITVENVVFLAKNVHRLGWRTLDYIQTNIGTRRHALV